MTVIGSDAPSSLSQASSSALNCDYPRRAVINVFTTVHYALSHSAPLKSAQDCERRRWMQVYKRSNDLDVNNVKRNEGIAANACKYVFHLGVAI